MDTGQKRVIRPPQPSTKASDGLKTSNQPPLTTPATAERWRQLPDLGSKVMRQQVRAFGRLLIDCRLIHRTLWAVALPDGHLASVWWRQGLTVRFNFRLVCLGLELWSGDCA